jgi:hypothetical protein
MPSANTLNPSLGLPWSMSREGGSGSKPKRMTIDGVSRPLTEWWEIHGVSKSGYYRRLARGLNPLEALTAHHGAPLVSMSVCTPHDMDPHCVERGLSSCT